MRRPILLTVGALAGLSGTLFADPGTRAELLSSPAPPGPGHLVAVHPSATAPAPTRSPAAPHRPPAPASGRPGATTPTSATGTAGPRTPGTGTAGTGTATTAAGPAGPATAGPATTTRSVDGQPVNNPYGAVQVRLVITGSTITDIRALQLPNGDGHSRGIAQMAVPQLRQQVLTAQSAQINGVSGATYTSDGYARSVQSALDSIGGHP